jgi:hypothetical protein
MVLEDFDNTIMSEVSNIFNACNNAIDEVDNINYGSIDYGCDTD